METWGQAGVVLLIGQPGVGKSLLGNLLAAHPRSNAHFLNVGERLRECGLVEGYQEHPTEAGRQALASKARELRAQAFSELARDIASGRPRVLVMEGIKEAGDGFAVLDELREHRLKLLQVIYLHDSTTAFLKALTVTAGRGTPSAGRGSLSFSAQRDQARLVEERQPKWEANAAALLELFSAQGVLAEAVARAEERNTYRFSYGGRRRRSSGRGFSGGSSSSARAGAGDSSTPDPPGGSLAAIGYAPAFAAAAGGQAGQAGAAAAAAASMWVQGAGWCDSSGRLAAAPGISLHWIEPVVSSRLVSSAAERDGVLAYAAASTGLSMDQPFAVPVHSAVTPADARWVGYPGRFLVSRKCDGTRHLLLVAQDGAPYLLSRSRMLYRYPASGSRGSLPPGTVLDGELVWAGPPGAAPAARVGFFLAFDVLAVGSQRCWQLPLSERQEQLRSLGLEEAETSPALQAAAAGGAMPPAALPALLGAASGGRATAALRLEKKQQAPPCGSDSLMLLRKQHLPVSGGALHSLEDTQPSCPYPTDGLVFTPAQFPYALGMPQLLFKWQLPQQAAADLSAKQLQDSIFGLSYSVRKTPGSYGARIAALPPTLVYECVQLHPPAPPATLTAAAGAAMAADLSPAQAEAQRRRMHRLQRQEHRAWLPQSVRWDKQAGNADGAVQRLERRAAQGRYLTLRMLADAVQEAQQAAAAAAAAAEQQQPAAGPLQDSASPCHPACQQPFQQLYAAVMAEVEAGTAERTVHSPSGLEIFCYLQSAGPPRSLVAAMCRGLVLHPPSSSVVAAPFVRFGELGEGTGCGGQPAEGAAAATAVALPLLLRFLPGSDIVQAQRVCKAWQQVIAEDASAQEAIADARREHALEASQWTNQDSWRPDWGGMLEQPWDGAEPGYRPARPIRGFWSGGSGGSSTAEQEEQQRLDEQEEALLPGSPGDAANLALYTSSPASLATASFKLDGSLVIAFKWQGQLYTATRRRMDSEQAIWARDWLQAHPHTDGLLEPGWTYLFEAVYRDNTHVVQYSFEGLVLLSAVAPDGRELAASERQQLARRLAVLAAPCLEGPAEELRSRLSRGTEPATADAQGSPPSRLPGSGSQAPPSFEGWVLEAGGSRCKLVQASFKRAGAVARGLMHPLLLWDAVRCGGASRAQLAAGLPAHMRREMNAELDALEQQYCAVQHLLAAAVQHQQQQQPSTSASASASTGTGTSSAADQLSSLMSGLRLAELTATAAAGAAAVLGKEPGELCRSAAFQELLRYALKAGSSKAGRMFLPSDFHLNPGPAPLLRGLVLACIQPGTDGSLAGYHPSPAFAQTHVKAWQRQGPAGQRVAFLEALAAGEPPPDSNGISLVAWQVLPMLDGWTLADAALVCKEWHQLIAEDATCQAALSKAKAAAQQEQQQQREASYGSRIFRTCSWGSDVDYGSF